jgi:hypothetical protein
MAAPTSAGAGQIFSPIFAMDLMAMEVQEKYVSGLFLPQNTAAPTKLNAGYAGNYIWSVTRTGVGVFSVTVKLTTGFVEGPFLATVQNPSPKNVQVTICIDPAGTQQNVIPTAGPVVLKANTVSFGILLYNSTTGAASDITQPGSPTNNGSFIMWRFHYTELRNPPRV